MYALLLSQKATVSRSDSPSGLGSHEVPCLGTSACAVLLPIVSYFDCCILYASFTGCHLDSNLPFFVELI